MKSFQAIDDLDLAYEILGAEINHDYGNRFVEDMKEGLEAILDEYGDEYEHAKYSVETLEEINSEMIKHINKLEKMLKRRDVKFKDWQTVEDENNLYY